MERDTAPVLEASLPDALRALQDEASLRDLVARYADAVGRADEAAWAATWTDDAVWEIGASRSQGRDAVVRRWSELMAHFRLVVQLPQLGSLEVRGDEARGRSPLVELGWPASGGGVLTVGCYDDRYRRTAQGWRFARRSLQVHYMGAPDLSGRLLGLPGEPPRD